jgi:hypothetical protein
MDFFLSGGGAGRVYKQQSQWPNGNSHLHNGFYITGPDTDANLKPLFIDIAVTGRVIIHPTEEKADEHNSNKTGG